MLLIVPVGLILWRTFAPGVGQFVDWISTPAATSALNLSVLVVAIVVPLNVVFGIPTALMLARNRFRGKGVLQAIIDLPFAVSPVVVGVALIVLWDSAGLLGFVEKDFGFKIIFGLPGIVLASVFATLPFIVREVEPVLHEIGTDQEQAASTLGSGLVADLLADHAAVHPVGPHLRDRVDGRSNARRVWRGPHRLVEPAWAESQTLDAAGGRPLQPRRRVRGLRTCRRC